MNDRPGRSVRALALVTDAYGCSGGIAQYNCDFLAALSTCDRMQEVFVLPRRGAPAQYELPDRIHQLGPTPNKMLYFLSALAAAIKHRPIDVVFCGHLYMSPLAAVIARLAGAKLWLQVHGLEAWRPMGRLRRYFIESADLITSVSRYTRRRLLEWVNIAPNRVKVLSDTVADRYAPGPKPGYLLDRYDLHRNKVIMTVSRLNAGEQYKGHEQVLRSLPQLLAVHPSIVYLVVGDGDDRPRLERIASELGVREQVLFLGAVEERELPDHYRLADLFVMPSAGEGFGIVFLEAMASGVPVIGGNADGSLDPLCDGRLGTVIDPTSIEQLEVAVATVLANLPPRVAAGERFQRDRFGSHLQALVRSFDLAKAS